MKTLVLLLTSALALTSFTAHAHGAFHPRVRVGIGWGAPFYDPYWYDPWFSPYWYPPYPVRGDRTTGKPSTNLYVYPSAGQTADQTKLDRTECHDWAVGQVGSDPTTAKRPKSKQILDYNRAFTACMEGRNYSVE
jgi:hypothetical protein